MKFQSVREMCLMALLTWPATFLLAVPEVLAEPESKKVPEPLLDPIPETIDPGDIVVAAVKFVRAPRSEDAQAGVTELAGIDTPLPTSDAYARLQYLQPIPDGSGRLIVSDLRGLLYLTNEAGEPLSVYLDLRQATADFGKSIFPNEAGLLGFAFHPNFANPKSPGHGRLYTAYSASPDTGVADHLADNATSHHSVLREWTTSNPQAKVFAGSSREILRVGQFAPNHNIATLAFNRSAAPGTAEAGMLYIGMGDGGSAYDPFDYGQNPQVLLGTILRIDPLVEGQAYGVPGDNPFIGRSDVAPEIWAYGLRHPQHFSFDVDGRMFINDIGQNHIEEVNVGVAGANYGWRVREGTFATGYGVVDGYLGYMFTRPEVDSGYVYPVAQYDHDEGNAVGTGFVYRGKLIPALWGKYVMADLVQGRLFYFDTTALEPGKPALIKALRVQIDGKEQALLDVIGYENTYAPGQQRADLRLSIDSQGELYLLSKGDGWIRKLVAPR